MNSKNRSYEAKIRLHSSVQHPGQAIERQIVDLHGRYHKKLGRSFLVYNETQDGKTVRTTVKMGNEDALILRSGGVDMRLPFQLNQDLAGQYGNGPLQLHLLVKTERIEFTEEQDGKSGRFSVRYDLISEASSLGNYELTIDYMEEIE